MLLDYDSPFSLSIINLRKRLLDSVLVVCSNFLFDIFKIFSEGFDGNIVEILVSKVFNLLASHSNDSFLFCFDLGQLKEISDRYPQT